MSKIIFVVCIVGLFFNLRVSAAPNPVAAPGGKIYNNLFKFLFHLIQKF
jgi:hypothetical protein